MTYSFPFKGAQRRGKAGMGMGFSCGGENPSPPYPSTSPVALEGEGMIHLSDKPFHQVHRDDLQLPFF
jgi:hypothetical protein